MSALDYLTSKEIKTLELTVKKFLRDNGLNDPSQFEVIVLDVNDERAELACTFKFTIDDPS